MDSDDFKEMVMCLRTKKAKDIRRYYLSIEKLFKMYCEYTLHFNTRREERRVLEKQREIEQKDKDIGKKECTIEALRREIREANENAERIRQAEKEEADRKHADLMARNDAVLAYSKYNKDKLDDAVEKLEIVEENLDDANGNLLIANEKLEEAVERIGNVEENLEIVRNVAVPKPLNEKKLHKIGLVKMSPDYVPDPMDPGYVRECNAIIIRRQKDSFDFRVKQIRGYGNGTNQNAEILIERENPNSINLSNRLREHEKDGAFYFTGACGIRYTDAGNDQVMIDLVEQIHQARLDM
ncbi:008L [Cherax quadricarinatus iridovirus]|nr:008L [Cherax quadricarinatus iridovirus]UPA43329.1 008L [Iridovirus CN01]ASZ84988.1 008L [Cherax quadricarinatus iridovirus]UPA43564.1 008L [Iridovirus CN01]UPA43599.1 008L [Iridovirus CN01]UPA43761.1 008L [Iridovirus CN01]